VIISVPVAAFETQYVGTHIGEQHAGIRPGANTRQLDNFETGKGPH
jgi:hypothetical protein